MLSIKSPFTILFTHLLRVVNMVTVFSFLLSSCSAPSANRYFVAVDGADDNPGSLRKPFRTIQHAANQLQPGDVCYILEGIYRESFSPITSGTEDKPIRFQSYKDEKVVLDGTEPLRGGWELYKGNIYKTKVPVPFDQLFCDGLMMVEARWPNMSFPDQLWDRGTWASAGIGSRYGKMVDPNMAETGIDWTGAIAVLSVAHQFRTWTRKVLSHKKGTDTFIYKKDIEPITSYAEKTSQWEDDRYYLFGKLEALDAPGEWYLDRSSLELYFWCPEGGDPALHKINYKARDYLFEASRKAYIQLSGLRFFGSSFQFSDCNFCQVEKCRLEYPVYSREFNDPSLKKRPSETVISGNNNRILNNYIVYAQVTGLGIIGSGNLIENNIIHDVAWNGQGFAVYMNTTAREGNILTRNTAYNAGYSVYRLSGKGNWIASYNHLYNAALLAKDCAVIQTGGWDITGSVIHHNWVHDCYPEGNHPGGLKGGLGIRGDDQTRGLTVHHNVVYNCGRDGIIVKGDTNMIYSNTIFDIGSNNLEGNYISMHTEKEPYKPWRFQMPLLEIQNLNSKIFNNAALNISGDRKRTPFTPEENLTTNYYGKEILLNDPENFEFTPAPGSPLIDAGMHIPGFTEGFKGKAPEIGAYEVGDTWKAGADWSPVI